MADSGDSLIVRISSEVSKPRDDRPFDGVLTLAFELSAMGSPAWDNGRYGGVSWEVSSEWGNVYG